DSGTSRGVPLVGSSRRRAPVEISRPAASSEIDLRGMLGEEAEAAVLRAIDDAILDELPALRLIHGKGTGALRQRVSDLLKGDRRVKAFQLAPREQGGSGVTIAELA